MRYDKSRKGGINMNIMKNEKGQAIAPKTKIITKAAFQPLGHTEIRWLGGGGIMINSRGTNLMIDPVLEGFDMPLLIEMPILPHDIPKLDGILITHIDNDHMSVQTCQDVKDVCSAYHAPHYVAQYMSSHGIVTQGHDIADQFNIGTVGITLTPARHNWQNGSQKYQYRFWEEKDYCGYWLDTEDGTIWLPGDSKLLKSHLQMPSPDVILFDFADNEWHITLDGAIKLANTYPEATLICIHWGSVDAPDMTPFNGNPELLFDKIIHPERIQVLAPGEAWLLGRKE